MAPGPGSSGWLSGLSSVPGFGWIDTGQVSFRPAMSIGYKKIALDFGLDIPPTQVLSPFVVFPNYGSLLDTYPLQARLQSADLAIGSFRLDAQFGANSGVFGAVSANIPCSVGIDAQEGPGIGVFRPQAWHWTGSSFQWSEFEFGGWYGVTSTVGLVGGIRFDRMSVRFSDPEPVPEYSFFTTFPRPPAERPVSFPDYSGDFLTLLTTPYIGCQMFGSYYKTWVLVGSTSARLRLPLDLTHPGVYIAGPIFGALGRRDLSEQAEYTFKRAGLFLEAGLESAFPVGSFSCTLWAKGNWLRIRGNGEVALAGQSSAYLAALTLPEPFSASSEGTSTLNQYTFDLGFSGSLPF
jgi:hypothetical protein